MIHQKMLIENNDSNLVLSCAILSASLTHNSKLFQTVAEEYEKAPNIIWFKRSFNQKAIGIVPKMIHNRRVSQYN